MRFCLVRSPDGEEAFRVPVGEIRPGSAPVREGLLKMVLLRRPAGQEDLIGLTAPALDTVRVCIIGLGMRGRGAVHRFARIPGAKVVALCDLSQASVDRAQERLAEAGHPAAAEYAGSEDSWMEMCRRDDIDLVYVVTDWKNEA